MNPQNLIFLDFDGVINSHGGTTSGAFASPENVAPLNRILEQTDAKIVVCSAWRYLVHNGYMTVPGMATFVRTHGIKGDVIDVTRPSRDPSEDENEPRWKQIADWIKRPQINIKRYAILDDDPDAFGGRLGVQTNGNVGLTMADAERAIEILNSKE